MLLGLDSAPDPEPVFKRLDLYSVKFDQIHWHCLLYMGLVEVNNEEADDVQK
jgi:hypothetical protein